MRLRCGFGHACRLAGVLFLALAMAACSGQAPQPKEYGLGEAEPVRPGSIQDFAANAGDVVHFQVESVTLTGKARAILGKQALWLQKHPQYRVILEGHADEGGTAAYDLKLGAKRAMSVKDFLVRKGVDAARIHTVSYGRERQVAICDDSSCWSQNRRVKTVLKANGAARR